MKLPRWLAKLAPPARAPVGEDRPLEPAAARTLGLKWLQEGDAERAEVALRLAVHSEPQAADAHLQLAEALRRLGKYEEALASCLDAAALAPHVAQVHNNLGNAYKDLGDVANAIAAYRKAIELDGTLAEAHLNLGTALHQQGAAAQARHCYEAAVGLTPGLAEAHLNLGYLEEQQGRAGEARRQYELAIAANPQLVEARFNHALQLLLAGEYGLGWEEYEWRMKMPQWRATVVTPSLPQWGGEPVEGKSLLLYAEQGFGDALQFVRYAPLVAARGARILLQCQPKMKRLFATVEGVLQVAGFDEPAPPADACCPLLSVPRILGTVHRIPAQVPYVRAQSHEVLRWKERLRQDGARLKVGLFWATESATGTASQKSLSLQQLAPLAGIPDTIFYSLQRGPAAAQTADPPLGMRILDVSAALGDFADSAALVGALDLVVTIDTALAHLAGALGRPVWTLIHTPPDWRWGAAGEASAWYPTMRLFRQERAGEWQGAVARLALELRALAERRATRPTS